MSRIEEPPPGWLTRFRRGCGAGIATFAIAVLLTAVPTLLAWFAPGADSTSAGSALRAAVLIAISAQHGGVMLDGVHVTLAPLLVTVLLGWLVAVQARRPGSVSGFAGWLAGYAAAVTAGAHVAKLGSTRAPVPASLLAAVLFGGLVGGAARYAPAAWARLDNRRRAVIRAAGVVTAVYLAVAAVLAGTMLLLHLSTAVTLQRDVATGAAGFPLALLGVAAVPNAVIATVGYLTGAGFTVGATHVSPLALDRTRLPTFPLLAALPSGAPALLVGGALVLGTALLATGLATRLLLPGSRRERIWDLLTVSALTAAVFGGAGYLASGALGSRDLSQVGVRWWGLAATMLVAVFSSGVVVLLWRALLRLARQRYRGGEVTADVASPAAAGVTPIGTSTQVRAPRRTPDAGRPNREDDTDSGVRRLRGTG